MDTQDPQTSVDQREYEGPDRRESVVDRRLEETGLERRRGPGRRRSDFVKAAEEGQMTREQFLFVMAVDAYKRVNQKPYPTWTEVLEVIRKLGYRKTSPSQLGLDNVEDWTESPDAPAFAAPVAETDQPEDEDDVA
ncbi:MAG: hypothetical protein IT440_01750 [Phycisphaeraceae bacterium]|nr:hypothetical protein [Phycisphaeraceae bacterium]